MHPLKTEQNTTFTPLGVFSYSHYFTVDILYTNTRTVHKSKVKYKLSKRFMCCTLERVASGIKLIKFTEQV